MPARVLFLVLCATYAWSGPAVAQAVQDPQPLYWHCVQQFDQNFHVLCRPAGSDASRRTAAPEPPHHGAVDMRPVALRGEAEVFSADAWRVPLHSQPTDSDRVLELLGSVLCGQRPGCIVRYEGAPVRTARR